MSRTETLTQKLQFLGFCPDKMVGRNIQDIRVADVDVVGEIPNAEIAVDIEVEFDD